jgi:hypothetical protein
MLRPLLAIAALAMSVSLFAKDDTNPQMARPKLFEDVVACKTIENAEQRLACYDEKEAKRGLFGFDIPKIKIFGGGEDVAEIEAVVKSVSVTRAGIVSIVLEDGARWQQVDTKILNREPRAGSKARIRKASMGSYLVNFDGGPAIRMRRVN